MEHVLVWREQLLCPVSGQPIVLRNIVVLSLLARSLLQYYFVCVVICNTSVAFKTCDTKLNILIYAYLFC